MELIHKYFPDLSNTSSGQLGKLFDLYSHWNTKINLISRKDIRNLYLHHVLHSLAIVRFFTFNPGSRILDAGTGGGFPGIPLAILCPDIEFTLVDSVGKKVNVVKCIAEDLGLKNIKVVKSRIEEINDKFEFIVSRAVTSLPTMVLWIRDLFEEENRHPFPNGLIYLKGGDLKQDLVQFDKEITIYNISDIFPEPFFETKKIIHFPADK